MIKAGDLFRPGVPCECDLCRYGRHIDAVKERGSVKEMRELIDELADDLWNLGEEYGLLKMERHGSH